MRAADYGWKFGVILFAMLASVVVVFRGWPPRLGVDLGGGSILVYKVDETKTEWRPEKMDSLLASISKRVNPGGQKEISVRSLGSDMVEIVMPSVSGSTAKEKQAEADEIRKIIRTTGALEFRIVATKRDNESLIEMAKAERQEISRHSQGTVIIKDPKTGKELAKWCRVRDQEVDKIRGDDAAMMVGTVKVKDKDGKEVEKEVWEVLVLSPESEAYNVTGADVRDARSGIDQETAMPEVLFSFNSAGGVKFGRLTGEHVPIGDFQYRLAIVLDDVLQTAPTIRSQITDNGQITGNFTQKEVDEIVEIINAGSLPAALEPTPVRDMTTEATLGAETIRQSTYAMIIASIVVPLFMLFYYRFAGLVAVLVLGLNMLILVALMILIKAPFTLAGPGRPGADGGHGGGQQRADLRAIAGRNRPRGRLAHGDPQRLPSRGRGDHRRQHHAPHRRHGPLERGHRADQGLCRHLLAGGRLEHLGHDVRRPRDVRSRRTPPLGAEARHDAVDRPHEDRLHGLVPRLRDLLGADHRAGNCGRRGPRQGPVRHRLHRRRVGADRLPGKARHREDPRRRSTRSPRSFPTRR